jgi:hypothetical protein
MRKFALAVALLSAWSLFGQQVIDCNSCIVVAAPTHQVVLNWTASVDGGVVTVYRAAGACSASSVFTAITTGVAANTFTDSTVTVGSFCYQVTTVVNGSESLPSNQITARILPSPPTALAVGSSQ